jgi:hypothetical protein
VNRKNSFHADAAGYFSDGNRPVDALAVFSGDHKTLEWLNSFLAALLDFLVDNNGMAGFHFGQTFELFFIESFELGSHFGDL